MDAVRPERFHCVVQRFFEAVAAPELWPEALHELARACGASGACALPLRGSGGADVLNGNGGSDTADYFNPAVTVGITVDLANPVNNTGEAAGDTYSSIENVRGTAVNDTLRGDGNTNFLDGQVGADILDGAGGNDYAWYNTATTGVTANLADTTFNTGDAAGDT
jgi:hypothetical protein